MLRVCLKAPIISGQISVRSLAGSAHTYLKKPSIDIYVPKPYARVRKPKTEEELAKERFESQLKSENRFIRWGAIARTEKFGKKMTKYMFLAYGGFLIYSIYFIKKLYKKDKEIERLVAKQTEEGLNEYETLRLKELQNSLRTRDKLKLEIYNEMKEKQGHENFDGIILDNNDQNKINVNVLPPMDTTDFYDHKADEYDSAINLEEKAIFMGKRRKWLMKHCQGDVLEVSCGTGRNIKYLDPSKINSVTFLDSSQRMLEITNQKFRERFPTYNSVAFVKGRAEELLQLSEGRVKYDTIIEAFGICSHEDPVKALRNFGALLKPGGRIYLLEHGRGDYDFVNNILDARSEKRLKTWGCRWNLDLGEILDDSGLEIVDERKTHFGTTWCITAKRKGDTKKVNEIGFVEKYLRSSVKQKIASMENKDEKSGGIDVLE